jgi:hypothetical protein
LCHISCGEGEVLSSCVRLTPCIRLPPSARPRFPFFSPTSLSLFARLPHRAAAALTSLQIGHASWMEDALSDRGGRPALDTSLPLSRRQPHRYPLPQHRRLGFAIESPPPQISSIAPAATPPATVLLSSRRRRTPLLTSSHRTAVDPFSQAPRSLCPSLPPRSTHGWDVRSPLHLTHPSHGRGHRCSIRIRDCATSARGPCRRILSLHAELQARRFQRLCSRWTSTNCSLSPPPSCEPRRSSLHLLMVLTWYPTSFLFPQFYTGLLIVIFCRQLKFEE